MPVTSWEMFSLTIDRSRPPVPQPMLRQVPAVLPNRRRSAVIGQMFGLPLTRSLIARRTSGWAIQICSSEW